MSTKSTSSSPLSVIGIDIGKDVFHLVGFDADGTIVLRKKIKRLALVPTFEKLPYCIVGMEACLSAHFVSRTLRKLGFKPRIIPAIYVKPFLMGQKNDYNDAEAIAEAALRPNLRVNQIVSIVDSYVYLPLVRQVFSHGVMGPRIGRPFAPSGY